VTAASSSELGGRHRGRDAWLAVWTVAAAFGTYFCMYAFRKPFVAASYEETTTFGLAFKTVLVASQVFGYMLAKFIGIKVISEMPPHRRVIAIVTLIAAAEAALILFALVPRPWNAFCLFLNGLPLGMIFGLVLSFLEGRRLTELLAAGLCASFIIADGVTKSVGTWLLMQGVSEEWMPSLAGAVFLAPIAFFIWMLARVPAPDPQDVAARAARAQMTRHDRWNLFQRYAPGLTLLLVFYLSVTVLRSIRADFAPEIWRALGESDRPEVFTQSETLIALGVLVVNGCASFIRNNRVGFFASLATSLAGLVLVAWALLGRGSAMGMGAFPFMVLLGLGLYLPYVAVHTTVFERLLAMTRERGNIGFLMYLADSIAYLGYISVMLIREFASTAVAGTAEASDGFLKFFLTACWITCGISAVCLVLGWRYFATRPAPQPAAQPGEALA
jgi:hypothetical protein